MKVYHKGNYMNYMEINYKTSSGTQKNDAIVIKYLPGVSSHDVQIVGLKKGTGKIRFQIRDAKASYQELEIVVKDLQDIDAGPDYGTPDGGPDKGAGDVGSKEASTSDKGSKEASTSDKGSPDTAATVDAAASKE